MSTPESRRRVVVVLLAAELADASEHAALACRTAAACPADLRWHMHAVRAMADMHDLRAIYAAAASAPLGEA